MNWTITRLLYSKPPQAPSLEMLNALKLFEEYWLKLIILYVIFLKYQSSDDDTDEDPEYEPNEESSTDGEYETENISTVELNDLNLNENIDPIGSLNFIWKI